MKIQVAKRLSLDVVVWFVILELEFQKAFQKLQVLLLTAMLYQRQSKKALRRNQAAEIAALDCPF